MRNLLIIILAAVCVWLLVERGNLTQQKTALTEQISDAEKKAAAIEQKTMTTSAGQLRAGGLAPSAGGQPQRRGSSWLDAHIEEGARKLEPKKKPR